MIYVLSNRPIVDSGTIDRFTLYPTHLQEETMWWSRVVNITIVVSMIISVLAWVIWFTSQV